MIGRLALVSLFVLLGSATAAGAQAARTVMVHVRVVDTADHPIEGADLALTRGLRTQLGHGAADRRGERVFVVPRLGGEIQVTARKLGYAPASQFVSPADEQTIDVRLVLRAAAQSLAPVAITAQEDILRRRNHLDADDILHSPRPVLDGLDVIAKLRPDILDPPENTPLSPCGLFNLWVNGKRVILPSDSVPLDDQMLLSRLGSMPARPKNWVAFALAEIKPEYIDEITYKGCNDKSMEEQGTGANNAAYVVLKPGIGFDWKHGSYVVREDDSPAGQLARKQRQRADSAAAAPPPLPVLPAYRHRLLGLYDAESGEPIVDAAVTDTASGTTARTSPTGTVSLAFLPEGSSTLRIQKAGYEALVLDVHISPADTVPLTLTLVRQKAPRTARVDSRDSTSTTLDASTAVRVARQAASAD